MLPIGTSLLLAGVVMCGQTQAGLRLTLESHRTAYLLGEPVYLTARLRNEGSGPQRLLPLLNPKDGMLTVSVRGPSGQGVAWQPLSERDNDTPMRDLASNEVLAAVFPVYYGASGWTFRTPGAYQITARFVSPTGGERSAEARSDPVTITIRSDSTESGQMLLSGRGAVDAGKFLVWGGGDHLTEGMAHLSQVADRFPTSPIADHYRLALGRSLSKPFKNYGTNSVRAPDYTRALTQLGRIRPRVLPTYLEIERGLAQSTSLLGLNRSAEAQPVLRRTRSLIGSAPEFRGFVAELERLEGSQVKR